MKALLRPLFVGGLSIAIAATSLVGSSSVALAANLVVTWTFGQVYVGEPVFMTTPGPIDKGSPVYLTAKFTGGAGHGPYALDVDWGDGTSESYSFANAEPCDPVAVCVTAQKRNPYANVGSFTVVVFLDDPVATRFNNLPLSVVNSPPSFTSFALSATEIEAGQAVTATGRFTDETTNDTHTVKVAWDDNSPLTTFVLPPGARAFTTAAHTYEAIGNYTVSVIVTDGTGRWTPETATLSVHEPKPNQAPTMAFEFTAGPEGGNSTLAVTFADADAADTHTVLVEWGDGQTTNSGTLTETTFDAPHVYADIRNYSLVVTLTDSATPAHSVTETRSVSPTNVAPEMGTLSLSPSPVVDRQELTVTGSFVDPTGPGTTETFTLKVVWGDNTPSTEVSLETEQSFSARHTYSAPGPVTITATVTDANGGNDSATSNLVVGSSNHAPSNLTLNVSGSGANVVVNASFDDPDAGDSHTVVMTWGDGESALPIVEPGTTKFTASHVYTASRTYTVSATVTDAAGAPTSATAQVVVTVSAGSAAAVLDEMADLVRTFDLDRNTERWLLKKIDDLKASLAYGNGQVCSATGLLNHILAFADRTTSNEHLADLRALTAKLEAAAGCTGNGAQSPKVQKAATVTAKPVPPTTTVTPTTSAPTPKKDTTAKPAKADLKATEGRNSH
jgi:PKD repeat protein